jgi:DNA-directed RNA polymerase specialized sigma subunit
MRYEEGLTGREIGALLGISPSQANRRIVTVQVRLRVMAESEGLGPDESACWCERAAA